MRIRVPFVSAALSTVMTLGLLGYDALPAIANANQSATSASTKQGEIQAAGRLGFRVRSVRPSRARTPGISRGSCSVDGRPVTMTALVPRVNPRVEEQGLIEVESTVSARPTFFVHIPQNRALGAEFTLTDGAESEADRQTLYYTQFSPSPQAGVIGITLPTEAPELEVGKTYHWSLRLQCDAVDRSGDVLVEGWVQRESLNAALSRQIALTSIRNRPLLYARSGIWQDTLATLAQLRLENQNDTTISADWVSLLDSVNLEAIAQDPILNITAYPAQTPPN
ncbi:DUF928 domain-containing protein [Oscillatoria sp. FACHB-1407]|uniref:DUF928 domain-containing protein n=1 Tax=Oscillatoria sp. FACHB-1407 TaxID=2692847 RepID=UPI0016895C5D|nr:DUF928 domain-containing protein [Oscillatoria sp. FACHB-1407]MBD2464805.1 DUF928 domain-containing protein [Oscillatoria sp. FACHB-1407]